MSADLSRVRFDPLRDHSGVGIQQGRLWLDADFNEQVAITDRRLRAQVVDLAPAPSIVSRQTPDAFELTLAGGKLSIGAGRMYVDGLLAENHGAKPGFEPVLGEPNGAGAVEYGKQPYWPSPDKLPEGGPHLMYLDVWERELTYVNAPDLVDSAIGVDTTTRTQTVWQVRALPNVGADATCGSKIAKWDELIAPSSARLTTGTVAVDPDVGPCDIPPGSGYRGPENQLYRVELHSPAKFKWSRDNASVVSAVTEVVSATQLRLHSLGRDEVLCIKDNDWVEITDDARELAQQPGEMRQVTVDVANSTIKFSPALPSNLATTDHFLRVRKWDSGLVNIPGDGSAVTLEHGITVTFGSVKAGKPRAGDYWVFAARATAASPEESLENLNAAPPRGTHHHYVKLGLVTLPSGKVQDCRPGWPVAQGDACGCTICVTPEQHNDGSFTIQDAIDQLAKGQGGTITLCPGEYEVEKPLRLERLRSIRIRGCGRASRLVSKQTAIQVSLSQDIVLSDFACTGAILFDEANRSCRLSRLRLSASLVLTGAQQLLSVRECMFSAANGIVGKELLTSGLSIVDNTFACGSRAVDLGIDHGKVVRHNDSTVIRGNSFTAASDAAIVVTGMAEALDICQNRFEVAGAGIVAGAQARINDNTLVATGRVAGRHAISLLDTPPDTSAGEAHIMGNSVSGFGGAGISIAAPMQALIVKQNVVRGTAGGIVVRGPGSRAAIEGNQVISLSALSDEPTLVLARSARRALPLAGIMVAGVEVVAVVGNLVEDLAGFAYGIGVASFTSGRIVGNTVSGLAAGEGSATGILVGSWSESVSIVDNTVLSGRQAGWVALRAQLATAERPTVSALGSVVRAPIGTFNFIGDAVFLQKQTLGNVELTGNTLQGGGEAVAVTVSTPGDILMGTNRASQPGQGEQPAVRLRAGAVVIQGNRLEGGSPSMTVDTSPEKAVVIGNLSTGGIHIGGTSVENLGKPWSALNPIA